jgi:hypothetical protein
MIELEKSVWKVNQTGVGCHEVVTSPPALSCKFPSPQGEGLGIR